MRANPSPATVGDLPFDGTLRAVHPVERASASGLRWLAGGLIASGFAFAATSVVELQLERVQLIHLGILTSMTVVISAQIGHLADELWFPAMTRIGFSRFASAAAVTVVITGVVGLVTLSSSAALRYDPSTQFLQLISALDIAWVVSAFSIGVRWLRGSSAAALAGTAMGAVCVWSIWRYVDNVGFDAAGRWIVSGEALLRYVIPFDVMAAVLAVGAVVAGIRRSQPTEQPSAQS